MKPEWIGSPRTTSAARSPSVTVGPSGTVQSAWPVPYSVSRSSVKSNVPSQSKAWS